MSFETLHKNIDKEIRNTIKLMGNPDYEKPYNLQSRKELIVLQTVYHHLKMARSAIETFDS